MPVIHLFTVRPTEVANHETAHVHIGNFYLEAETVQDAWNMLQGHQEAQGVTEAWAAPLQALRITPSSRLQERVDLNDHKRWVQMQETYVPLLQA